jgi:2-keto-4-pentenoate hydratase/2-oxohepta-3-ene-1,7-dioic acid hydratase in catechol pathway
MRIANLQGRLVIVNEDRAIDVEQASDGRFGSDPQAIFEAWDDFRAWAGGADLSGGEAFDREQLGPPAPQPRQIYAIGLNYLDHAAESGVEVGEPVVFTKYLTSITGPYAEVEFPAGDVKVDWEVELVVVIGRRAHRVSEADAWSCVAGLTVGQDISERVLQMVGSVPQFSLGKSYPGFGPTGPWIVTPDELADKDDLPIGCSVNGVSKQEATTKLLMRSVSRLVERLSAVTPLLPGDLIFTGTPAGVGLARNPPEFLSPGDVIDSYITGIGEIRTTIVAAR